MPKNVMKLLKPSPHRARNDFDLSHRHVFSINFGELLPSTCIETVPGDHIELHQSDLIRAIPMVTSPFLRAKQHTDVWFVPYHDLWHQFENFITKKAQPASSAFKSFTYLPFASLKDLWSTGTNDLRDVVGISYIKGRNKLLNLLGYGNGAPWSAQSRDVNVNIFRIAAYNYIWYNEYRQQYYDDGTLNLYSSIGDNPSYLFNFDYKPCDSVDTAKVTYSQLLGMLQMRYRCWKKDLFTGLLPSTQFGAVSTVDILGSSSEVSVTFTSPITASGTITGQTAANQSTGWDDDRWQYSGDTDLPTGATDLHVAGDSWYTQWAGSVLADGVRDGSPIVDKYVHDHSIPQLAVTGTANVTGTATGTGTATISGNGSFDVLALRKSEAIQIWRENALRAGNRVKDNMMAHYGVDSDLKDHRPIFLGSVSSPLSIGDVMATANSSEGVNNAVGDIAGKGLSSIDEKVFKFDAKDFGVIMAITSILPEAEYNATGISRPNQLLDSEDFFVPEYENLGLEAVSSYTFLFNHMASNVPVGYAPRYWAYKTKLDKCYGSFMTNGIYAPWCSPKYDVDAVLASSPVTLPLSVLYVNPKIFDVNFSVGVDNQDQFLADVYFDVDAVRPMSVTGLPFS